MKTFRIAAGTQVRVTTTNGGEIIASTISGWNPTYPIFLNAGTHQFSISGGRIATVVAV